MGLIQRRDAAANDMSAGVHTGEDRRYAIGDLAREFGVSLRTLRFYEDRGPAESAA